MTQFTRRVWRGRLGGRPRRPSHPATDGWLVERIDRAARASCTVSACRRPRPAGCCAGARPTSRRRSSSAPPSRTTTSTAPPPPPLGLAVVRRRTGGSSVVVGPGRAAVARRRPARRRPLWDDDVGLAPLWLGRAWVAALLARRRDRAHRAHRAPCGARRGRRAVCFAGTGPGEVGGRRMGKVVGISQRRTRGAAPCSSRPRSSDGTRPRRWPRWPSTGTRRLTSCAARRRSRRARSVVARARRGGRRGRGRGGVARMERLSAGCRPAVVDFAFSPTATALHEELLDFMDRHVYPAESVYHEQMPASGDPHFHPPVIEELKAEARRRRLWNLFLPARDAVDGRAVQPRLRPARRDHRAFDRARAGGAELRRARHRATWSC